MPRMRTVAGPAVAPKGFKQEKPAGSELSAHDLTPKNRPNAISHDASLIDALHNHIQEIHSRLDAEINLHPKSEKNKDFVRVHSTVRAHLDEARRHLDNAYAHHAMGGENKEELLRAGHSAINSYTRAATHVADALSFMRSDAGFGPRLKYDVKNPEITKDEKNYRTKVKIKPLVKDGEFQWDRQSISNLGLRVLSDQGRQNRLVTHSQLNDMVTGYQSHVRGHLERRRIDIPKGVADAPSPEFSPNAGPSELARQTLGARGFPLTYEEELEKTVGRREIRRRQRERNLTDLAQTTGRTHIMGSQGPVAGVRGIKDLSKLDVKPGKKVYIMNEFGGHSALLQAVSEHWEKNFGQTHGSFIGSEAHANPVEYAKRYNVKLPGYAETVNKALKKLGPSTRGVKPQQLKEELDYEPASIPKLSKNEKKAYGSPGVPNPEAKADVLGKRKRNVDFQNGRDGAGA